MCAEYKRAVCSAANEWLSHTDPNVCPPGMEFHPSARCAGGPPIAAANLHVFSIAIVDTYPLGVTEFAVSKRHLWLFPISPANYAYTLYIPYPITRPFFFSLPRCIYILISPTTKSTIFLPVRCADNRIAHGTYTSFSFSHFQSGRAHGHTHSHTHVGRHRCKCRE